MKALKVRFGSEHLPSEFVRPDELEVQKVLAHLPSGPENARVFWCWDFVCTSIKYPFDAKGRPTDRHILSAFLTTDIPFLGASYRVTRINEEFWQLPSETIAWGYGDCDDTAILLCSLLRNFIPPERVSVVVGRAGRWEHAWVQVDDKILETTLTAASLHSHSSSQNDYRPEWRFNDKMISGDVILRPRGDERGKGKWIQACWHYPAKL